MMGATATEMCVFAFVFMAAMFHPVFLEVDVPEKNDASSAQKRWHPFECSSRGCCSVVEGLRRWVQNLAVGVQSNSRDARIAQDRIVGLQNQYASLQQQLRATSAQLETNLQNFQNGVAARVSSLEGRLRTSSLEVGFTVKFSFDPANNVPLNGIYKFNQVETNAGGAYDAQTGMFTAPVSGLYELHFKFMSTNNTPGIHLVIEREGQVVGNAWANGRPSLNDQGSATVLVFMRQGQRAWVRHISGSTVIRGGPWTVFSGFLVQAE